MPRLPEVHGAKDLSSLRRLFPNEWASYIKKEMAEHGGRIPATAASLGVSVRLLYKWLTEEAFADVKRAPEGRPPLEGDPDSPRRRRPSR